MYFVQLRIAEGMIGGQIVDIINEGKKISEEELKYMHMKKTGALINVSIISGAILANAPKEDINLLEKFRKIRVSISNKR